MAQELDATAVAERLLRTVSRQEARELAVRLGLPDTDASSLAASLGSLPRYEIVRTILQFALPTLRLLQEIFGYLAVLGVSVRTTGCSFVLADPLQPGAPCELEFSPQAVGMVCDWRGDLRPVKTSIPEIKPRWQAFGRTLRVLIQNARPHTKKGEIDLIQSYIAGEEIRQRDRTNRHQSAGRILRYVANPIADLCQRLGAGRESLPGDVLWVLEAAEAFRRDAERVLPKRDMRGERTEPTAYELRPYEQFLRDFDRWREDVRLLADLVEGEGVLDLLRLDVWSSRPQLFEVWTLLTILAWLSHRGYGVELRKLESTATTMRWSLAYAKEKLPCASVVGSQGSMFLFYQLYRPSGDMPDLALLAGPDSGATPVWTVDPKHSELSGYTIEDYRKTAIRYRDSFGAPLSIVLEHFERADANQNPLPFGPGACLIHDCGPARPGLDHLLNELEAVHPALITTLVCLDASKSFGALSQALTHIRLLLADPAVRVLDEFVCFAGTAARKEGLREWASSASPKSNASIWGLEEGTKAAPLVQTINEVFRDRRITQLLLVTDGELDVPMELVVGQLRDRLKLDVRLYPRADL
jgi:hypothetical protein